MREITIRLFQEPLPENIHGFCAKDGKDSFIINIDPGMSEDEQALSFLHEMLHIWNRDHEKSDFNAVENATHAQLTRVLTSK